MNINWFEIVAQIINFIILLALLKKFFYKPVFKAMEKRQERIAEALNEADRRTAEAEAIRTEYEKKISSIRETESALIDHAKKEALEAKETLLETYRSLAEEKRLAYIKEIEDEKKTFSDDLKKSLAKNSIRIASNILAASGGHELENSIFLSFLGRIASLDTSSLNNGDSFENEDLILISSSELTTRQKHMLEQALTSSLGPYRSISYQTDESLVLGYELKFETLTLHNNIKKYLEESEKSILKTLEDMPQ